MVVTFKSIPQGVYKLFCCLLVCLFFYSPCLAQQVIDLNGGWQFHKPGDSKWYKATVPGTVHTDLLNNKLIGDPFYRVNEKGMQWIGEQDWEYKTTFTADAALLGSDKLYLVFDGLDTYADVYVNNVKVLVADNMFMQWKADVKPQLKIGINTLRIYFHSPIKTGEALYNSLPFRVPVSDNDQASPKVSVFTRKAGYHYGWDWGPRLVTSGLWRKVYIRSFNNAAINDVFIKQNGLTKQQAALQAMLEVESTNEGVKQLAIYVNGNPAPLYAKAVHLDKGLTNLVCKFTLNNPELWWPNGYGAQKLYTFRVVLSDGQHAVAEKQVRHGMRTVEVVQESTAQGNSFYFRVNGVKIFMKGANYIPQDNFLPRVTKERYEHIINTAVLSHMNMLRVWGGGIYENDLFYDLCDEKGILLWQEFMFACAMQPPIESIKQSIYDEAVQNIKRLRNHPSIAMYCGNNEVAAFMGSDFWGTAKGAFRDAQDSVTIINTYKDIFFNILPSAVKGYDDDRFYWSSSPQANNFSLYSYDSRTSGDTHYWGVWGAVKPMEEFLDNIGPFMSEYGFQSFPDMQTIKTFTLPTDYDINSEVMKAHQRSYVGNGAILTYMKSWYKVPSSFTGFLYTGQVLQAEGIKMAIEAHRRAKPFCMGSLYWQIDDCWPAASWSGMDYYGHWKAEQYEVKCAFATLLVSPVIKHDTANVYLVSDSLKVVKAQLQLRLMDLNGHIKWQKVIPVVIPPNSSGVFYRTPVNAMVNGADKSNLVLSTRLLQQNKELAQNCLYFVEPKGLNLVKPNLQYTFTPTDGGYRVSVTSPALVKNLRVSAGDDNIIFSDNYFDLLPGQTKTITFKSGKLIGKGDISFLSINDMKE